MKLKHGSLFSGIGGIELGLEWAGGFETAWQVEINPFCQKVLAKHWPNVPCHADVREVGAHNLGKVDIISGGFPCQDISVAGKQAGLAGKRSGLWFEYARIVRELEPRWVLIENVAALKTHGADQVLSDMEQANYTCWPLVVGAWSVGATHRRNRTWILCHSNSTDAFANELVRRELHRNEWSMAEAFQEGCRRISQLVPRGRVSGADAYTRIVRESDGIPGGVDRLTALGNAVVPLIPALIGQFVLKIETESLPEIS